MKTNAFVRQLASNKRSVRENALETLKKFLSSKEKANKLNITEFNKLWKGLFYTMWFCDRPRPQQRLANDLGGLFSNCIVDSQFYNFVESYWNIMIKEWRELDKWRLDKFLMLMRYVIRECFVKLDSKDWDEEFVDGYLTTLKNVILKDDSQIPKAIIYHIIDIWVDEIERVIFPSEEEQEEENEESEEDVESIEEKRAEKIKERKEILETRNIPIEKLLEPFKEMSGRKNTEALRNKIRVEILEDERLIELEIDTSLPGEAGEAEAEAEAEEEEEEEWTGFGN